MPGLHVTTLVPSVASIEDHIDLVVKQQITAIAGLKSPATTQQFLEPRAMHYGVWEVPVSASLPMQSNVVRQRQTIDCGGSIHRTASEAGAFHLLIDAAAIAASGRRDESIVKWLMHRVAMLRDRGLLRVETLACDSRPAVRRSGGFAATVDSASVA